MSQNFWNQKGILLNRQKRRAELISSYLKDSGAKKILDIGSAEGYTTSFISRVGELVIGVEIDSEYLRIAKNKVRNVDFINASLTNLPFRDKFFDTISVLEVLEHLELQTQMEGMKEIHRVLGIRANLIISVPYRENIIQTRCIHCKKITPLYGHLSSIDESYINRILPENSYKLSKKYRLPNIQMISCKSIFEPLPLRLWVLLNSILGTIRKGYWVILHYTKE